MKRDPFCFEFELVPDETVPCRIQEGFDGAGKTGQYLGYVTPSVAVVRWAVVYWDNSEVPELIHLDSLELCCITWKPAVDVV